MSKTLQHYLNPLHVYCRLRDLGLAERPAVFLCQLYERAVFNFCRLKGSERRENNMIKNVIYYVAILACILFFYFLPFSYAETDSNLVVDSGLMDKSENDLLRKKNYFTVLLGAVYWNNLADIEYDFSVSDPAQYGTFREWGYNVEIGYHRQVSKWLENDLLLGLDFGIFNNDCKETFSTVLPPGLRIKVDLDSRVLYLTPSVRLLIEKQGYPRFIIGAGLGYYLVDFVEQSSDCWEETEYFEEDTIGGYLSVGVDFPISEQSGGAALRVESKVHFMNFGDLGGIASGAGDLEGPVYMFQLGITF